MFASYELYDPQSRPGAANRPGLVSSDCRHESEDIGTESHFSRLGQGEQSCRSQTQIQPDVEVTGSILYIRGRKVLYTTVVAT